MAQLASIDFEIGDPAGDGEVRAPVSGTALAQAVAIQNTDAVSSAKRGRTP
jgi:hypothetical protein